MNGPAALSIAVGKEIVIMGFKLTDKLTKPDAILVDSENQFGRNLMESA